MSSPAHSSAWKSALFRHETTEDNFMPFLFWMPMIMLSGLWEIAEESAREMMQAGSPPG